MSFHMTMTAAAALLLAPAAAHASPVNTTEFEALVAHDDLDLTTHEGVSRIDERVRTRVRQLCNNGGRDSASLRLERECRVGALAATAPAIRMAIVNARLDRVRLAQTETASPTATPGG